MVRRTWNKTGTKIGGDDAASLCRRVLRRPSSPCLAVVVLGVGLLILGTGCGKSLPQDRAAIRGKVKLDGQPIAEGAILLTPMGGTRGTTCGGEIKNGQYELTGPAAAAIGWNRVEIRAARKTGRKVQKPMAPQGLLIDDMVEAVSPRFNTDSTLKVNVMSGDNTADFEVTSQ